MYRPATASGEKRKPRLERKPEWRQREEEKGEKLDLRHERWREGREREEERGK